MTDSIALIDWLVIALYLLGLIALALYLSRSQHNRDDYYVGGRSLGAWPVAISVMATQCSTNSILGAPAFVAFAAGGGLVWLQYELALPLAMIVLIVWLMPLYRQLGLISVYEILETRIDRHARLSLSALFLFVRAFATAVTVYSIAIVLEMITGLSFFWSVMLLGAFTVAYDVLGGMRGVVYSDVLQMAILVGVLMLLLFLLVDSSGGWLNMWQHFDQGRKQSLNFSAHGLGDGETFAFWPMLAGGLFLYVAYYGCDQSQVQRELSTAGLKQSNQALLINGLLRFPLVLLYCFVGVGIAVFASQSPGFIESLPANNGTPEYNLAVPAFMINQLPVGLVGLSLVALFAAAMSSLDSVINSLSATTMEDFVRPLLRKPLAAHRELQWSRGLTCLWGGLTLVMAFFVGDIAPTVLEAINKIGSLANGSILAVFALALLFKGLVGWQITLALILGIVVNAGCWHFLPAVSWLWWNPLGFALSFICALCLAKIYSKVRKKEGPTWSPMSANGLLKSNGAWLWQIGVLLVWFILLLAFLIWL